MQRMRDYELVMVISPEAGEDETSVALERVSSFVAAHGGSISEQESWGVRRLAYPIGGFQEGGYALTRFSLEAGDVLELDQSLMAADDVLRHLLTRAPRSSLQT